MGILDDAKDEPTEASDSSGVEPGEPHTTPPGEHEDELPDESDASGSTSQAENAGTSLDQPSQ